MLLESITTLLLALAVSLAAYIYSKSYTHGLFKKLGISGPKPWPVVGTMRDEFFGPDGMFVYHIKSYLKYKKEKVYGLFRAERPTIVVCDLDMIREICVKQFDNFPNHLNFNIDGPFRHGLHQLEDEHWKTVRSIVSPTFSTNKLKKMFLHIKRNTDILVDHIKNKMEFNEPVELKELILRFTMDTIASTVFGLEVSSINDGANDFTKHGHALISCNERFLFIALFLNFFKPILNLIGVEMIPKATGDFFTSFVNNAYETNKTREKNEARSDFIQLLMEAQSEERGADGKGRQLTYNDIQGQAMIFILAGYDTVATALSFALYYLAMSPECMKKAQAEVDHILNGKPPDYESVQDMTYLEMCINESLRLFPPGPTINRVAKNDAQVNGVTIPKGVSVTFPVCGIHRDPELWDDPETFDPERHTPENRATRHPYAFMPFGQGPRNCVAMRLGLLEMKIAMASILQTLTPVRCDKSVFPIQLPRMKYGVKSLGGLWVKFEPRK